MNANAATNGRIVTFYSYKGGTGRSMAMANVGWILASAGKRVLLVDWDLEAPGLHRYFHPFLFDPDLTSSEGLIDLLTDYAATAVSPETIGESSSTGWYESLADVGAYAISIDWDFPENGGIDLLPAGRQGPTYPTRVTSFNWQNFYDRLGGHGFVEALRRSMRAKYDYVLVDSRTGVSDTAGICTVQIPDLLVVCFTLNNQSIDGAVSVARSAQEQNQGQSRLPIYPVATRIEQSEVDRRDARRNYAQEVFTPILDGDLQQGAYWSAVELPYVPFYAYEEVLAAFKEEPDDPKGLLAALIRLTGWLTQGEVQQLAVRPESDQKRVILERFANAKGMAKPKAGAMSARGILPEKALALTGVDVRPNRLAVQRESLGADGASTSRFIIDLVRDTDGAIVVQARLDDGLVATERSLAVSHDLSRRFAEFLPERIEVANRYSADAQRESLEHAIHDLGAELGNAVFHGTIGEILGHHMHNMRPGENLELCFRSADPVLLTLPFEAARLSDGVLPALKQGVAVRRIVAGSDPAKASATAGPLKILVAVGAPDREHSQQSVLDLERELQGILDAIEPASRLGYAQVRFLEVGHPDEIEKALAEDEYHVLHLSGYCHPGAIVLEDEDGNEVAVSADNLASKLLGAGRSVPLAFLSVGGDMGGSAGVAVDLVRAGVPQVVAMQTGVSDRYASDLAAAFYRWLATEETPLPSRALARARQEIEGARKKAAAKGAQHDPPEFATASLFGAEREIPLWDGALDPKRLKRPPVHKVSGPVPQLDIGELVGRRREMRVLMRVLRDHPVSVEEMGRKAGVVVTGIGGIGKSSIAGRAMARLQEEGWVVAATSGPFSLADIARSLGEAAATTAHPQLRELGGRLADPQLDDRGRVSLIAAFLQQVPCLLVLDNFEDNLQVGGGAFLDSTTEAWLRLFVERADQGKLLITCRYPVPSFEDDFATLPLGPLSSAETRKVFLRLPGLRGASAEDLAEISRRIGGHPRMLEYLDGILRAGRGRFPGVAKRLREQAKRAGIDVKAEGVPLDQAMREVALLGARDVLLDELLAIAGEEGDGDTLLQCAVSSLPIDGEGVAHALADRQPSKEEVARAQASIERLLDLSLVARVGLGTFWVHRWTSEALAERDKDGYRLRCGRAGRYRLWRARNVSHHIDDGIEASRNLMAAGDFDAASSEALSVAEAMVRFHQSAVAASFAAEIARQLPKDHGWYAALVDLEASSLLALGSTDQALDRYRSLAAAFEQRSKAEPDRADYQRGVSVSYNKLGDLLKAMGQGEAARGYFEKSLAISERLAKTEPDRADSQRDLSVVCNRLGDLLQAMGQGEAARGYFEKSLVISERLSKSESDRADFQRDLSVVYNKLGDLLQAMGQGEVARVHFEKSLAISERLAKVEPDRADYQRDLSVSCNKLGGLLQAMGQGEAARDYFEKSLAIGEKVAKAEPDRADFQRDLSVAYNRLGDLLQAMGQGEAARGYFEKALAISERLAKVEPDRADYQRDLSVSCTRLGDLLQATGQGEAARGCFEKSLAISERLAKAEPDRADYQRDLSVVHERLGHLLQAMGQVEAAWAYFDKDLAISEKLAKAEPDRAVYQRDLLVSLLRVSQNSPDRTESAIARGREILERLRRRGLLIEQEQAFRQAFGLGN